MLRSRRTAIAVIPVALLLVVAAAFPAAGEATKDGGASGDSQQRRDEIATELELLQASDVDLQARLTDLDVEIAHQQALVADARAAQEAAEAEVAELLLEVDRAQERADRQLTEAQDRVVEAYMHPSASGLDMLIKTDDINELHKKRTFIRQVAEHDQDVLDEYVAAEEALVGRKAEAEAAQSRADAAAADADAGLAAVESARAEQEAVHEALEVKIDGFREEADALAAQEAELAAVIDEHAASGAGPSGEPATGADGGDPPGTPDEGPLPEPPAPPPTAPPSTSPPPTGGGSTTTSPPTTQPHAPASLSWPTSGPVTSPFGWRWGRMHAGIDIGAPTGQGIKAAAAGYVYFAGWMNGYGNTVLIDHGGGMTTLYGHQSSISVSRGTTVSRGQTIGAVGSTGNSTGPHLHFEVRINGTARDPMGYL